jgi:hypothetical protein
MPVKFTPSDKLDLKKIGESRERYYKALCEEHENQEAKRCQFPDCNCGVSAPNGAEWPEVCPKGLGRW